MVDGSVVIDSRIDQSGVNKGLKDMEKSCSGFASAVTGIFAGISIYSFGKAALQSTADIQLAQAKLETLLGDAGRAQTMINDIVKMADTTPYNSNELVQAATTLKTFGVTAEQITPTLTALGNAAGGQGESLRGIAYALGQTAAQGKMMTQDLYQFVNAGVPLLDLLSKKLGKNTAQIRAMIEEGKIGYKEVNEVLQDFYTGTGKYAGLMAKAAMTLPGMYSTMQDSITGFGRALVAVFEPAIKSMMGTITNVFSTLTAWLKKASPEILNVIKFVAAFAAGFLAVAVAVKVASVAFAAFSAVLAVNPFVLVTGLVLGLVAAIYQLATAARETNPEMSIEENEKVAASLDALNKKYEEVDKAAGGFLVKDVTGQRKMIADISKDFTGTVDKLAKLKYGTKAWTEALVKAQSEADFLSQGIQKGLTPFETAKQIETYKKRLKDIIAEKKKAAAKPENGPSGAAALAQAEADKIKRITEDLLIWKERKTNGEAAAQLKREELRYASERETLAKNNEALKLAEERHQDNIRMIKARGAADARKAADDTPWLVSMVKKIQGFNQDVYDELKKGAHYSTLLAFSLGAGLSDEMALGIDSKVYSVVQAVKGVAEAIEETFEAMSEIFDFGESVLDWITDFDYADTESAIVEYIKAIGTFFQSELGALPILFDTGAAAVMALLDGITANLPAITRTLNNVLVHIADFLTANAPKIIDQIFIILDSFVRVLAARLPQIAAALAAALMQTMTRLAELAPQIVRGLIDAIVAALREMAAAAPELVDAIMSAIVGAVEYIAENLGDILAAFITLSLNIVSGIVRNLPLILTALINAIPAIVVGILGDVPRAIIEALPGLVQSLASASPQIVAALTVSLPAALAEAFAQSVVIATFTLPAALLRSAPAVIRAIVMSYVNLPREMYFAFRDVGEAMLNGLFSGIERAGNIWDKTKHVFTRFVDRVKSFFGIHSPSTLFAAIGADIMRGLVNGILAGFQSAGGGLYSIISTIPEIFTSSFAAAVPVITSFFDYVETALRSALSGLADIIIAPIQAVVFALQYMINALSNMAGNIGGSIGGFFGSIGGAIGGFFASGTSSAPGGWSVVGEQGPELVNLKSGSTVLNAADSIRAVMRGLTPNRASAGLSAVAVTAEIEAGDIVIDGSVVGRVAFRYIDKQVKAAYGN